MENLFKKHPILCLDKMITGSTLCWEAIFRDARLRPDNIFSMDESGVTVIVENTETKKLWRSLKKIKIKKGWLVSSWNVFCDVSNGSMSHVWQNVTSLDAQSIPSLIPLFLAIFPSSSAERYSISNLLKRSRKYRRPFIKERKTPHSPKRRSWKKEDFHRISIEFPSNMYRLKS